MRGHNRSKVPIKSAARKGSMFSKPARDQRMPGAHKRCLAFILLRAAQPAGGCPYINAKVAGDSSALTDLLITALLARLLMHRVKQALSDRTALLGSGAQRFIGEHATLISRPAR